MKKVLQIAATVAFGVITLSTGVSAQQAGQTCSIQATGPQSETVCVNTQITSCVRETNNTITVNGSNYQVSQSGDATVSGNNSGGDSTSGGASNSNASSVNIQISNVTDGGAGTCTVVTTTRTPIETPPVGGQGGGAVTPAPVAQLPQTSSASPLAFVGAGLIAVAAIALLTRSITAIQAARK